MAAKMASYFYSDKEAVFTVTIYDTQWAFGPQAFAMAEQGFTLSYEGQQQGVTAPLISSRVDIFMFIQDEYQMEFLLEMCQNQDERRYTVVIKRDDEYFWHGNILADTSGIDDAPYPIPFTVSAGCGIAASDSMDYVPTISAGVIKIRQVLFDILSSFPSFANISGSKFLGIYSKFRETQTAWGYANTTLDAYIQYASLFEIDSEGNTVYYSQKEMLERLMRATGMQLLQVNGAWECRCVPMLGDSFFGTYVAYDTSNAVIVTTVSDYNIAVDQISVARKAGGKYMFFPALRRVVGLYRHRTQINYLQGIAVTGLPITLADDYNIVVNPDQSIMQMGGRLRVATRNLTLAVTSSIIAVYRITIKAGGYYLVRPYTFYQNGAGFVPGAAVWQATAGFYHVATPLLSAGSVGVWKYTYISLNIVSPPMPSDGVLEFGMTLEKVMSGAGATLGGAVVQRSFSVNNATLFALYAGGDAVLSVEQKFSVGNPGGNNNTAEFNYTAFYGDGPTPNAISRLQVTTPTGVKDSVVWREVGATDTDMPLTLLVAREFLNLQTRVVWRYQGTIYGGGITAYSRLSWEYAGLGFFWVFGGGTFAAAREEWTGEWWSAANYKVDVVDTSSGVIDVGGEGIGLIAATSMGVAATSVGLSAPALISSLAFSTLAATLAAGSVATLSVASALNMNAVAAGDKIIVINPVTGQSDTLTVAAPNAAGTTLSVTGILSDEYPEGSALILSPQNNIVAGSGGGSLASATYNSNEEALSGGMVAGQSYVAGQGHEAAARGAVMIVY